MEKGRLNVNSINGIKIPNECACMWCGGRMERRGPTTLGSGINSFFLQCPRCGAIVMHACDFGHKIESCEVTFKLAQ